MVVTICTLPVIQNKRDVPGEFSSFSAAFNPNLADKGGELENGVFRNYTCDFGQWDAGAVALVLGYLASIWSKVQHPGYPADVHIPMQGVTGEGYYDLGEHVDKYPNFQISRVVFLIREYPAGTDVIFGRNPLIKVGEAAFFISDKAEYGFDWGIVEPQKVSPGFSLTLAAGATVGGATTPNPNELGRYISIPGVYPGTWIQEALPQDVQQPAQVFATGTITFAPKATQPKAPLILQGHTGNSVRDYFPVMWINHTRATFVPPTPNVNGIWWNLLPGVVADVQIYGFTQAPGVEILESPA